MYKIESEIKEQPQVIAKLLKNELKPAQRLAEAIKGKNIQYIMIAARGSSDNAALYAKYLLASASRLPVALATPSLFSIYKRPPILKGAMVIGISQSGQSKDIISVLAEARRQKVITLVITNDISSPLAYTGDFILNCHAGAEKSIAATKTYTAQLALLALLAAMLSNEKKENLIQLKKMPESVDKTIYESRNISQMAKRYRYMNTCSVIGRGYNYATAFEIALKLKELNYITAEPYSSADFMHGPMAIVKQGYPVIIINPSGKLFRELNLFADRLKKDKAELLIISDRKEILKKADTGMVLPVRAPEWLSPIISVIPGQFLAFYLTLAKGYNPDSPRSLKKVTITR